MSILRTLNIKYTSHSVLSLTNEYFENINGFIEPYFENTKLQEHLSVWILNECFENSNGFFQLKLVYGVLFVIMMG